MSGNRDPRRKKRIARDTANIAKAAIPAVFVSLTILLAINYFFKPFSNSPDKGVAISVGDVKDAYKSLIVTQHGPTTAHPYGTIEIINPSKIGLTLSDSYLEVLNSRGFHSGRAKLLDVDAGLKEHSKVSVRSVPRLGNLILAGDLDSSNLTSDVTGATGKFGLVLHLECGSDVGQWRVLTKPEERTTDLGQYNLART